jgi:hypothetical protein
LRPLLAITLDYRGKSVEAVGLLDTGADVNVLPYSLGIELGEIWEDQKVSIELSGNLARHEARGIILSATVSQFEPVRLAFAWTRTDDAPLLLGRVNFFAEFDVCFYGSRNSFEIRPKESL